MKRIMNTLALSGIIASGTFAAIRTGPEIGAKLPNFEVSDQDGKTRKLSDLLGPKGAVLVIYRSADW